MSSIKKILFDNLNKNGIEGFSINIKKCIQQGIVNPKDLKVFSQMTFDYIDKLNLSQTASLLHSFSIPIYRNFQLFTTLTSRIKNLLENKTINIEDSIKIINSCGRLHYSDTQLFHILLNVVKNNIENIRTKNIVSILHSLTKLRYTDYDLLSYLSLVPLGKLDEISDIALANFSIAVSKIYSVERIKLEKTNDLFENGKNVINSLIPEIKSRCSVTSPLDNLRHIIALSNMKHLNTDIEELKQCLDQLVKFLNCPVLYYEHLTILIECLTSLNYFNIDFTFQTLIPNLLNKRTESNTSFEVDLRLLKSLSSISPMVTTKSIDKSKENKEDYKECRDNEYRYDRKEQEIVEVDKEINNNTNNTFDFLLDQIISNLSKNIVKHSKYIGDIFNVINKYKNINPDIFLESVHLYLERENGYLDIDIINQIKESIKVSNKDWNELISLMDNKSNQ